MSNLTYEEIYREDSRKILIGIYKDHLRKIFTDYLHLKVTGPGLTEEQDWLLKNLVSEIITNIAVFLTDPLLKERKSEDFDFVAELGSMFLSGSKRPRSMGAPLRFPDPTGDPDRDRIIKLRRRLNLSQADLGKQLYGLSEGTIRAWESGRSKPSGGALEFLEYIERWVDKMGAATPTIEDQRMSE